MKTPYVVTAEQDEIFNLILDIAGELKIARTHTLENRWNNGAIAFTSGEEIRLDGSGLDWWIRRNNSEEVTVQKFIQLMKEARVEVIEKVKLNDDYTAEVSKDGVKVGCQKFPLSIIDDLSAAKAKITK